MAKIVILSQEIYADTMDDLQSDALLRPIKIQFIKNCVLVTLSKFINSTDLPQELMGFALHLECEIKKSNISKYSDNELLVWLEQKTLLIQQRERSYQHWNRNIQTNKISCVLNRLKLRLFSTAYEESNEVEVIMAQARNDLKNQIEKDIIMQILIKAINAYQATCYWPISKERSGQQQELFTLIEQAPDAHAALNILHQAIMHIEQRHVLTSFAANLPCFLRKSRLAFYLHKASQEIALKLKTPYKKTVVEQNVELAIQYYLDDDIFYHNRKRQILAQQLLMQLRMDNLTFTDGQEIQKKHKMRTTLDHFIKNVDEDFKNTHFFAKFYKTKRSRLALNLEIVKKTLVNNQFLSALELENQIKQPVIDHLKIIFKEKPHVDILRDLNSLTQAIIAAQTSHGIEAIIEGHIRSYLQQANQSDILTCFKNFLLGQDNTYFRIAVKLESALLDWQTQGILPAASGYKTFLETLATNRQNNENDLQRLEQQYHIKIPRASTAMHEQANGIQQQALVLLKRIHAIK